MLLLQTLCDIVNYDLMGLSIDIMILCLRTSLKRFPQGMFTTSTNLKRNFTLFI